MFNGESAKAVREAAIKPSEMSRELKLKLALARLLPDDIEVTELCNCVWKRGEYAGLPLRETEWEYVFNMARRARLNWFMPKWQIRAEELLDGQHIDWFK